MTATGTLIIEERTVRHIIKRFAYEIYENNFTEKEIVLVGILGNGYEMAQFLLKELEGIAPKLKVTLVKLDVDKDHPIHSEVKLDHPESALTGKSVLLVDDVLNSGRTMAYCMASIMNADIKRIETVVLVNRSHKRFPMMANHKGYELSTTIDEHVEVRFDEFFGVYLS